MNKHPVFMYTWWFTTSRKMQALRRFCPQQQSATSAYCYKHTSSERLSS